MWFFETKNPSRYREFLDFFPENTVLSVTIETNRSYDMDIRGATPSPVERFFYMQKIQGFPIHISHEPLMQFDLETLISWDKELKPIKVAVGLDSLHNNLPEPPKDKTLKLIAELEKFTDVERKQL